MPNINAPFGFAQVTGTGASPTFEQVQLAISPAVGTNAQIFCNDPVAQLATGFICQLGTQGTAGVPAAGSGNFVGMFTGCKYLSVTQKRIVWSNYYAGAGDVNTAAGVVAYVITDPAAQYQVQTVNALTPTTTTNPVVQVSVGMNVGVGYMTGTGTNTNTLGNNNGNVFSGISTAYADQNSIATTPGLPFRIMAIANYSVEGPNLWGQVSGYDPTSPYNRIVVSMNNTLAKQGTTGI
jgi:hypothetical protein